MPAPFAIPSALTRARPVLLFRRIQIAHNTRSVRNFIRESEKARTGTIANHTSAASLDTGPPEVARTRFAHAARRDNRNDGPCAPDALRSLMGAPDRRYWQRCISTQQVTAFGTDPLTPRDIFCARICCALRVRTDRIRVARLVGRHCGAGPLQRTASRPPTSTSSLERARESKAANGLVHFAAFDYRAARRTCSLVERRGAPNLCSAHSSKSVSS